ncbi:cupin domain-containing protein [Rhodobacteraceae bacterium F11138]|nr:cupin domain-containing protein [Rhodobacteraceae bacterium F11138]
MKDAEPGTDTPDDIGANLRYARKQTGMTLKELAVRVGCSESLLSKIERGRTPPTLATLYKLSEILGISVASMFSDESHGKVAIYDQGQRPRLKLTPPDGFDAGVIFERMVPYKEGGLLDANLHIVPPGGGSSGTYAHRGEEVGFVVSGYVELTVDGKATALSRGSSFFFDSELPHSYRNIGSVDVVIVWVAAARQD